MTIQEKQKVEKILIEDINATLLTYKKNSTEEEYRIVKTLTKSPDKKVLALIKKYEIASKTIANIKIELAKQGVQYNKPTNNGIQYEGRISLLNSWDPNFKENRLPKKLEEFRKNRDQKTEDIKRLKRTCIIKLFAKDTEATKLLDFLQKELAKILK